MHSPTLSPARANLGPLFAPAWHRPWLRFIDTVDGADAAAAAATDAAEAADADGANTDATATAENTDAEASLDGMTPEQMRAAISKLRRENAARRTANRDAADQAAAQREQDVLSRVAAALGLGKDDDEAVTIESLQQKLTEANGERDTARSSTDELRRENAVLRYAPGLGANGDRLLDSRTFLNKLSAVDPSEPDAVKTAITDALTEDASFRLVATPGSSGGTNHGGSDSTARPKTLAEAARERRVSTR